MPQNCLTEGAPKLTRKERKKASIARRLMPIEGGHHFSNLSLCNFICGASYDFGRTGGQRQRHSSLHVLPSVLSEPNATSHNLWSSLALISNSIWIPTNCHKTMICKLITNDHFDRFFRWQISLHHASPHCRAKGFTPKVADETPKKPVVAPLGQVWDPGWCAVLMFHLPLGFI